MGPKDEFEPDDPMELVGVGLPVGGEREMVLAVIDEYVRLGFSGEEIVSLFRDPCYTMTNRIFRELGEAYVRECVDLVMTRWSAGASTACAADRE